MAGHRKFETLRDRMSPTRRQHNADASDTELEHMLLSEVRRATGATQVKIATEMGVTQSALSRLESQDDMQVSTLRRLVEALGAHLEIIASLPGKRVSLEFSGIENISAGGARQQSDRLKH